MPDKYYYHWKMTDSYSSTGSRGLAGNGAILTFDTRAGAVCRPHFKKTVPNLSSTQLYFNVKDPYIS